MSLICATCGQANREAARFCAGCGDPLAVACRSCGAELPVGARFCDACGAAVSLPDSPASETRKVVSVVFADLAGSTALQEALDAESVRRVMARFYEVMRGAVERHGGRVEKLVGDAVVASFGVRELHEDDALRAVRAAAAMREVLPGLNDELEPLWGVRLRMRTGVNTGELVVGADGELVGDMMNTAARLEQAAGDGDVLVGEATWRLVRHSVELEAIEPLELKGKAGPVRAWRLVAVTAAIGAAPVPAIEARLVGRDPELGRLRGVFEKVLAGRVCRLVTVMGSPGVGKTRLASELAGVASDSANVVVGRCEPTGEGLTFLPVAEVLRAVAGIGEADPADEVREKLGALVPPDDPDRARLVEGIAGVVGVAEPASAQETFWALRRGLEFLARRRPLVLVLDDLHWGQPMLLDLVEHLVEWVRDAPVLILALARPELRDAREALAFAGRRASDVIELEPLDETHSRELVSDLLGDVRVPPALSARILQTTEGNPLFLGETVRMLVDEGVLRHEGDGWVMAGDLAAVEVPPTIQALLAARIERLGANERAVVQRAAVIGKQFYRGAVAELVAPSVRLGIDSHLEALRRKDMVEPDGTYWIDEPVYRFHHVLIRDAAYKSLLKEARADLHECFADWLEVKAGELVGEHEEVIAFHLEQSHSYRRELGSLDERGRVVGARAAARLHSAGRRALAREDLAAAANLLGRALACEADGSYEILWDLCEAVLSAGDTSTAATLVERLSADGSEDPRRHARAAVLEGQLANLTGAGEIGVTAERAAAAAGRLRELGDRRGEAKGYQVAAGAYARLGRVALVEEALDRALAAARAADDTRRTTAVLAGAPRAALWGPSPVVRASGRCLDVVRILRMTPGNRHVEAVALRCQAVLEAMRGRAEAAREILAAGGATLQELGLTLELHETAVHAGIVELLADAPAAAAEHLRSAREGFETLGVSSGAAQAAALLARALVEQDGSGADALEQTLFAEEHGGEDLKTMITWCSARAETLASLGDHGQALEFARRAVALAEPTDALADKADASIALARVLKASGHEAQAREAARAAVGWYREKGHVVGVERAATLADERAAPRPTAIEAGAPALGDSRSERFLSDYKERFDAHDVEGVLELYASDWVLVDHRKIGWAQTRGRDPAAVSSVFEVSPDIRLDVDQVLACDDRVLAGRLAHRGSSVQSEGQFELPFGIVLVVEGGRWKSSDIYEPDDDAAILARFAELQANPPQRFRAEFKRRFDGHDVDGCIELTAENWVQVDHRKVGWGTARGRERARELLQSVYLDASDLRVEIGEVLACDDRVIAERGAWRGTTTDGGGEFEVPFGMVSVIEDGRRVSEDVYEPDDRDAMLARYAELGRRNTALGGRPPERMTAEYVRRWALRDVDKLLELYTPDHVLVDHRALSWEEIRGRDAIEDVLRHSMPRQPNMEIEIDDVLACDDRVIAVLITWRGRGVKAGEVAYSTGNVNVVENGLWVSCDMYEPEDRAAILARYAELGGRLEPARKPDTARRQADRTADEPRDVPQPADWLVRHDELLAGGESNTPAGELIATDVIVRDRRGSLTSDARGIEAYRALVDCRPGARSTLLVADGDLLIARRDDDPPLLLVGALCDGRLAQAIVLRDESLAREWLAALVLARDYEAASVTPGVDGLMAVYHPEAHVNDHRPLQLHGAADSSGIREFYVESAKLLKQPRASVEVLDVHPGVQTIVLTWSGTDRSTDGAVEWRTYQANRMRDGLVLENHIFAEADAALAKAEDLRAQTPPSSAGSPWKAPFADDVSLIDGRPGGWGTLHGAEAVAAKLGGELSGRRLADRDEATLVRLTGGSVALAIAGVDRELAYVEIFEHADAAGARFALVADDLESLVSIRLGIAWFRALNRRELSAARAFLADEMVIVDHRPASPFPSELHGGDAYFDQIKSLIELSSDVRWWFAEGGVPAGPVSICTMVISGHWTDGGGWAEIPLAALTSRRGDRFDRFEFFPVDAHAEQQARLAELTAQRGRAG